MVPEHDIRVRQLGEQRQQLLLGTRPGEQIAGHADEIGLPLRNPIDRTLDGAHTARRNAEMEVRQMRDAKAVELRRQARQRQVQDAQPHPARLEPAIGSHERRDCGDPSDEPDGERQTSSFSRTG